MIICDFCSKHANLHICDKCYNIAKRLLEMYEEKRLLGIDKPKKKRGRPKKIVENPPLKRRGRPKKQTPPKKVVEETEKERPKDSILSKCWTCQFGFIGTGGKAGCTEQKEPEICGQK